MSARKGSGLATARADSEARDVEKLAAADTLVLPRRSLANHRTDATIDVVSGNRAITVLYSLVDRASLVGMTSEARCDAMVDVYLLAGRQGAEITWTSIAADRELAGLHYRHPQVIEKLDRVPAECQRIIARPIEAFSNFFVGRVRDLAAPTARGCA